MPWKQIRTSRLHHQRRVRTGETLCLSRHCACLRSGLRYRQRIRGSKTFAQFYQAIGLDRLAAIHVNDSKTARDSRVDRHEHIGKGKIGLDAFRFIMRSRRLNKIPKVLETPKGKELREDVENLNTLRGLL